MWTVATSGALETGTRPHYGFADMLYDYLMNNEPDNQKIAVAMQECIKLWDEK